MKVRSFLTLAVLAGLCATATSSFAEGNTYKIVMQERQKAGDVTTKKSKRVKTSHGLVKRSDGTGLHERRTAQTTTEELIEKVLEVDEQGQVTNGAVYFVSWSLESEGERDISLTGLHVAYEGRGELRRWKVLTPGEAPSEAARAYLDHEYGTKNEDHAVSFESVMGPTKEIEIGESWNLDVGELAKLLGALARFDLAKSTAQATFVGIEGNTGEFLIDIALQTVSLKTKQGESVWKEGGVMRVKIQSKRSLVENDPTGSSNRVLEVKGLLDMPSGATMSVELGDTKYRETKQGGEMPAIPGAPETTK